MALVAHEAAHGLRPPPGAEHAACLGQDLPPHPPTPLPHPCAAHAVAGRRAAVVHCPLARRDFIALLPEDGAPLPPSSPAARRNPVQEVRGV